MTTVAPDVRDIGLLRAMRHRIDQQDPGAFNNLGVLYHSKGMYADAVDAFLRALAIDPRMRTAARNLEIAATQPGAFDASLARLDEQLEENRTDATARRERARLLRLLGRQSDAAYELDVLIAADPDDAMALFERGLIEQRAGELRRAQRWFERASNVAPHDPMPRLHLAEVLYQRGHNERALEVVEELLFQWPTIAEAHLLCSFVLGDMGRHEAARVAADQAQALNPALQSLQTDLSLEAGVMQVVPTSAPVRPEPEATQARYGLGVAFRQRGYFAEARKEFERARAQGEDARLTTHAIAELDLVAGRHAAARGAFDVLLREWPDDARYWNERGVALHQGGSVEQAADSYRRALRSDPRYALAYNNLGVALSDLGESAAAREALLRADEIDPSLARARLNLARWYVRQRDPLAALTLLRELVSFRANDADAWFELGCVHVALDRAEEARSAFTHSLELRPAHAGASDALAHALAALGDADDAIGATQRELGMAPVRVASRLTVGIDIQYECPDAAGEIDLLDLRVGSPTLAAVDGTPGKATRPDETSVANIHVGPAPAVAVLPACQCDDGDALAARGLHREALDRYAAAAAALGNVAGDGDDVDARSARAALRRRALLGEARSQCLLGHGHRVLGTLRRLAASTSDDDEVVGLLALAAVSAAQQGRVAASVGPALMRRLLRMTTRSAALLHLVGDTAVRIGEAELAMAFFRRALGLDPARPSPRVAIARLLRSQGNLTAARLEILAALATSPTYRDAILELADIWLAAGQPAEALVPLTRYLANASGDIDALVLLLTALMALQRLYEARVVAQRILRNDPDNAAALWFAGLLLVRQSRVREAVERWRRVRDDGYYTSRAQRALARVAAASTVAATAEATRRVS